MNRMILVLNTCVLLVNLFLSFATSEAQGSALRSAASMPGFTRSRPGGSSLAPAFLRVVQSLERALPRDALDAITQDQLLTLHEAVGVCFSSVERGTGRLLGLDAPSGTLREAADQIGREAREEVLRTLRNAFRDDAVLQRLTTEILSAVR